MGGLGGCVEGGNGRRICDEIKEGHMVLINHHLVCLFLWGMKISSQKVKGTP